MTKNWLNNLKPLKTDGLRSLSLKSDPMMAQAERAMDLQAGLSKDLKHIARADRRKLMDLRHQSNAMKHLERLPIAGEAFHCICKGSSSLWSLVPTIATLAAPAKIQHLHIATLGFSKANTEALFAMLDNGSIGAVTLLCSHYFSATSKDIYSVMASGMEQRGQVFKSMRSHAKILAIAISDGQRIVVESSANLRSCKNIEQMTLIADADLYTFHTKWIDEVTHERT